MKLSFGDDGKTRDGGCENPPLFLNMHNPATMPQHVAIIMDGNGRWAESRGLPRIAGHRAGADAVNRITEAAREMGVKVLTLYSFSTENWKRPKKEVEELFRLLEDELENKEEKLNKNGIKLSVIGDIKRLPLSTQEKLSKVMDSTKDNSGMVLNLALNYGARAEIINAVINISKKAREGAIRADDIDEKLFSDYLSTAALPDPGLLIRTSGECRISNFLLWQIAYTEFYITKKLWPDFQKSDFRKAVEEYKKRERRFGG